MNSRQVTTSTQIKSADTTADIEYHTGFENRVNYKHKNKEIDKSQTQYNEVIKVSNKRDLQEEHYKQRIINARKKFKDDEIGLDFVLNKIDGAKVNNSKNVRRSTASQISYFGSKDLLNPVLDEMREHGISDKAIRDSYTTGYKNYVEGHNEAFPTLPIYRSDIHFDEVTPHGHDAIVVKGHTKAGRASDSVNNALGEKYGYNVTNKVKMRKYRDENDSILFESISSELEELAQKHGLDIEFEGIRTGELYNAKSSEEYKKMKDFKAISDGLQEVKQVLDEKEQDLDDTDVMQRQRSKAQKKNSEIHKERIREVSEREQQLNVDATALGNERERLLKLKEQQERKEAALREREEMVYKRQKVLDEQEERNIRETHGVKMELMKQITDISKGYVSKETTEGLQVIRNGGRFLKPEVFRRLIDDTVQGALRQGTTKNLQQRSKNLRQESIQKDDGPEL